MIFRTHRIFIPNQEDLEDAEGLPSYLFNIISAFRDSLNRGKTKRDD